jgi:hypothetical protein
VDLRKEGPFGPRPGEHVFGPAAFRPPSARVRPASRQAAGRLQFEPETESQVGLLSAALAPAAVPQSSLAFEPDEGEALDRVSRLELERPTSSRVRRENVDVLRKLAAAEPTAPPGSARAPARADLKGDLEAEMFGPRKRPHVRPARGEPAEREEPEVQKTRPLPTARADQGAETATGPQSWISVFLSEQVAGKRRRRRSTIFTRNTGIVGVTAGRVMSAPFRLVAALVRGIDRVTSRYRMPLANLFWSALITGLALSLGVSIALGVVFFGVCLVLTLAGQPARNLLGFAGIILSSAAIAEIIRQRARFFEILMSFFS